jgi:hypothetical protein
MSAKENVSSLADCEQYCGKGLGGPPMCSIIKYDKLKKICYWGPDCVTPISHEMLKSSIEATGHSDHSNIYQIQCRFTRSLLETCVWANDAYEEVEYDLAYNPHLASWDSLRKFVEIASNASVLDGGGRAGSGAAPPPAAGGFSFGESSAAADGRGGGGGGGRGRMLEEAYEDNPTYGLVSCLRQCENWSGSTPCHFIAYDEQHMTACLLLGELEPRSFKKECGYTFASLSSFAEELKGEKANGEKLQDRDGIMANPGTAVKDVLSGFYIYMLRDADFEFYAKHTTIHPTRPQPRGKCDCKPGYIRFDERTCALLEDAPKCTEAMIMGPFTMDGESNSTFIEQIDAAFEDCIVFWDCNSNGNKDVGEVQCVLHDGAKCHVAEMVYGVDACTPIFTTFLQTGRNCKAEQAMDGATTVVLQVVLVPDFATDCPVVPIELGVVPTDAPTPILTSAPSLHPTTLPTDAPTPIPTSTPTAAPTPPTSSPTSMPTSMSDNPNACDLCGTRSCNQIEKQDLVPWENLTTHQATQIAFGFDSGLRPGSSLDTVADTIGACIFCEVGSSRDPNQCIFTEPDEKVKHWKVCDPLCGWASCQDIQDMIAKHFIEGYNIPFEETVKYVERFMVPLCHACPAEYLCSGYGTTDDDDDDDAANQAEVEEIEQEAGQEGAMLGLALEKALMQEEEEQEQEQELFLMSSLVSGMDKEEEFGNEVLIVCLRDGLCPTEGSTCALADTDDGPKVAVCNCEAGYIEDPADPEKCIADVDDDAVVQEEEAAGDGGDDGDGGDGGDGGAASFTVYNVPPEGAAAVATEKEHKEVHRSRMHGTAYVLGLIGAGICVALLFAAVFRKRRKRPPSLALMTPRGACAIGDAL